MVTLTREPSGEYYVSFTAEVEIQSLPTTGNVIGVDLGITTLAALSNGEKLHYGTKWRAKQRYLKRCQRALARTQKGSKRRQRTRRRVARSHAKIANHRKYCLHQLTTELVRKNDIICIEDLNAKGLARGFLAGAIQDASFGEFRRQLAYKCQWYGRTLICIDRYFASSKTCSCCGAVKAGLTLAVRSWKCEACGASHDRDVNAAKNIVAEGLRILRSPRDPETEDRSLPGGERPGNGQRMREVTVTRALPSVTVLANEASTRKAASACLEQVDAA